MIKGIRIDYYSGDYCLKDGGFTEEAPIEGAVLDFSANGKYGYLSELVHPYLKDNEKNGLVKYIGIYGDNGTHKSGIIHAVSNALIMSTLLGDMEIDLLDSGKILTYNPNRDDDDSPAGDLFKKSVACITSDDVFMKGTRLETKDLDEMLVAKSDEVWDIIKSNRLVSGYGKYGITRNNGKIEGLYDDTPILTTKYGRHKESSAGLDSAPKDLLSLSTLLSVILSMEEGNTLFVEDIDLHLSNKSLDAVIKEAVKRGIQLAFTANNTFPMQDMRPDQVYFSKHEGYGSTLLRLSDAYPNIRKANNIEKMYRCGIFDDAIEGRKKRKWLYRSYNGAWVYYSDLKEEPLDDEDECYGPFKTMQECWDLMLERDDLAVFGLGGISLAVFCSQVLGPAFGIPELDVDWTEYLTPEKEKELLGILAKRIDLREEKARKMLEKEE